MRPIFNYIGSYFSAINKLTLLAGSALTGLLVFLNYHFGIEDAISRQPSFFTRTISRFLIYFIAFAGCYSLFRFIEAKNYFRHRQFLALLIIGPLLFAIKASLRIDFSFHANETTNDYLNQVLYWPVLLLLVISILFITWKFFDPQQPFYGTTTKNINWKPYWLMLLIMLPLIAAASTQPDFLAMYPKLKETGETATTWWQKVLFELSYGSDFIGIEIFFRGFLVLAFVKWAGKDAMLPMACFYCCIHFGKPLGECISSYFGGLLLGIVVYHTKSIWGGLMVHLGIAWLMELGGYIGNGLK